jgi:hypothetical protein
MTICKEGSASSTRDSSFWLIKFPSPQIRLMPYISECTGTLLLQEWARLTTLPIQVS